MAEHTAPIIGYLRSPLSQKFGAPRQPNLVALQGVIEMVAPFDVPEAFEGLCDFSHLWLTWQFHHNDKKNNLKNHDDKTFRAQVRPPRLGGNQKIGVFASRSMYRPSRLGLSVVKLENVLIINNRTFLQISGADLIDGTPIIDIKPYIPYSDALPDASFGFAPSAPKPIDVVILPTAQAQFEALIENEKKAKPKSGQEQLIFNLQQNLLNQDLPIIKALIAQDPRPAYRQKEVGTRFTMRYKSVDVSFYQENLGELQICDIRQVFD